MNAQVGGAGSITASGYNINNPDYTQFFKTTQIPQPSKIFALLDEHPDSVDDGFFLDKSPENNGKYGGAYSSAQWTDLPASYHNGATAFSFADGHGLPHRWLQPDTIRPPLPNAANLPTSIPSRPASAAADFNWAMEHIRVDQN